MKQSCFAGKTILIVDDEGEIRRGIAEGLQRKGFNVLEASTGRSAFELILSNPVDAVVTDVRMPDGTGIELLNWIKARDAALPVTFVMTGFADVTEPELLEMGAEAVFQKPFRRRDLLAALERLLTPPEARWIAKNGEPASLTRVDLEFPDFLKAGEERLLAFGRGGIFVQLSGEVPRAGECVTFSLRSIHGLLPLIEGRGAVRSARGQSEQGRPAGCGIEFLELHESCRQSVVAWIAKQKFRSYIPMG